MKKLKLIIPILLCALAGSAQKLPSKVTINLTDKQVLRIDSAIQAASNWTDSKGATQWYIKAFEPFYIEVRRQLDTVKVKKP
jgi:hypothetical protein